MTATVKVTFVKVPKEEYERRMDEVCDVLADLFLRLQDTKEEEVTHG